MGVTGICYLKYNFTLGLVFPDCKVWKFHEHQLFSIHPKFEKYFYLCFIFRECLIKWAVFTFLSKTVKKNYMMSSCVVESCVGKPGLPPQHCRLMFNPPQNALLRTLLALGHLPQHHSSKSQVPLTAQINLKTREHNYLIAWGLTRPSMILWAGEVHASNRKAEMMSETMLLSCKSTSHVFSSCAREILALYQQPSSIHCIKPNELY